MQTIDADQEDTVNIGGIRRRDGAGQQSGQYCRLKLADVHVEALGSRMERPCCSLQISKR
jgi:hypothetical protein